MIIFLTADAAHTMAPGDSLNTVLPGKLLPHELNSFLMLDRRGASSVVLVKCWKNSNAIGEILARLQSTIAAHDGQPTDLVIDLRPGSIFLPQ